MPDHTTILTQPSMYALRGLDILTEAIHDPEDRRHPNVR